MVKKRIKLNVFLIITSIIIIFLLIPTSYADISTTIDPTDWEPSDFDYKDVNEVLDMMSVIVSIIRTVGIVVTVVVLLIIGIKYMTGSLEEKAEYKTSMKPYLIGVIIFFGISQILPIIIDLVARTLE